MSSAEAWVNAWTLKRATHELYKEVHPNRGHLFIYFLNERGKLLELITQIIDGLHSLAGLPDDKIVELKEGRSKGSLFGLQKNDG